MPADSAAPRWLDAAGAAAYISQGAIVGRWTVLEVRKETNRKKRWLCQCTCGTVREVHDINLRLGRTRSCGCLRSEVSRQTHLSHGKRRSRTYKIWAGIKSRCLRETDASYDRYGGRGIRICSSWMSFEAFLRDMGEVQPDSSIERIDNNGDYGPENCRWATDPEQRRNTRRTRMVTIDNSSLCVADAERQLGLTAGRINSTAKRLSCSYQEAVNYLIAEASA